jgi:hypothetical protein
MKVLCGYIIQFVWNYLNIYKVYRFKVYSKFNHVLILPKFNLGEMWLMWSKHKCHVHLA